MDISYSNNTIADWIHYVADQRSKWQSNGIDSIQKIAVRIPKTIKSR